MRILSDKIRLICDKMDSAVCCICFETLNDTERRLTSCNHIFHTHCLEEWEEKESKTSEKRTCPYCRKLLSTRSPKRRQLLSTPSPKRWQWDAPPKDISASTEAPSGNPEEWHRKFMDMQRDPRLCCSLKMSLLELTKNMDSFSKREGLGIVMGLYDSSSKESFNLLIGYLLCCGTSGWREFFQALHELGKEDLLKVWYGDSSTKAERKIARPAHRPPPKVSYSKVERKPAPRVASSDSFPMPPGDVNKWMDIFISSQDQPMVLVRLKSSIRDITPGMDTFRKGDGLEIMMFSISDRSKQVELLTKFLSENGVKGWREFFRALRRKHQEALLEVWYGRE